jgi:lipopolysaccharide/colanic/teichoic acid biosynthesis glycosyltransferase
MYRRLGKRVVDLALAIPAAVLLAPVMLLVAAGVWWKIGRPVLFRQLRPGLGGTPFELVKFRTMRDAVGGDGRPLPDSERLTRFGTWLRSMSLDELPELLNVLRGDMSLVGPRPLLMSYLPRYSPEEARRHEMPPGLTGWAQINGRNALSWSERFALDVWYVDHVTWRLDVAILFRTIRVALRRDGVNADGEATMTEFMGSSGQQPRAD